MCRIELFKEERGTNALPFLQLGTWSLNEVKDVNTKQSLQYIINLILGHCLLFFLSRNYLFKELFNVL